MEFGPGSEPRDRDRRGRAAGGADALAVAGGDGSLATVAAAALAHDLPFVCVPAGTRNHFARDLGLDPADPTAALDALSDGIEGRIDVGEVNGHLFLNNVSLGIYAEAVRDAGYRDAKVRTLVETARRVLGPATEISGLDIVDDLGDSHTDPAIVLVSNNPYALGGPLLARRPPDASGGRLGIDRHRPTGARTQAPGRAWSSASLRVDASSTCTPGSMAKRSSFSAARVRDPAGGAAGQNASPGPFRRRQRSSAATASGAKATPLTDPAIASSG